MTARPDIVDEAGALDREATPGTWFLSEHWGDIQATTGPNTCTTVGEAERDADALFICRARELVPALAAEVKALRADLAMVHDALDDVSAEPADDFAARVRGIGEDLRDARAALLPEEPTEEMVEEVAREGWAAQERARCTEDAALRWEDLREDVRNAERAGVRAVLRHLAQRQRKEAP
jgi:hypothetical protein